MAKRKSDGGSKNRGADRYDPKRQVKAPNSDIVTAAQTLADAKDYSAGYPPTFDKNMHINQGRPARGRE